MCIQFIMDVFPFHTVFLQEESWGCNPCRKEHFSAEKGHTGSGQFGDVTGFGRCMQCLKWACPCKLGSCPVLVDTSLSLPEVLVLQSHSWITRSQVAKHTAGQLAFPQSWIGFLILETAA